MTNLGIGLESGPKNGSTEVGRNYPVATINHKYLPDYLVPSA